MTQRLFWQKSATAALLSILFFIIYGGCNHLTALRTDVDTFYFAWERFIPFVPWMVVPYLSIDLFFVIAPFLCTTREELTTYRRRMLLCLFGAGICFLLVPLKFTFPRPEVGGILGAAMRWFWSLDLPYNEFPSLHIAFRAVMVGTYARHTRGLLKGTLHVWFSLIGFSTLLVYQHHVIDILGGFVLAGAAYCVFQERENVGRPERNLRVGTYYAIGAALFALLAVLLRPIGILLLWPASSLAVTAAGYFGAGAMIYRKRHGNIGAWAWLVLWPVLLGQTLSRRWYARQCPAWNPLADHVWIGRQLTAPEARQLSQAGIRAVLDLTSEFTEPAPLRALHYHSLPILDLTAPTPDQLQHAVTFIEKESREGIVYVHCKAGYSRTATVAGAWLMASGKAKTAEEAVELLRTARPSIIIRPEAMAALQHFANRSKLPAESLSP